MKKIVILGAGYAGLSVVKNLSKKALESYEIVLVDEFEQHAKITQLHKFVAGESDAVFADIAKILPTGVKFVRAKVSKICEDKLLSDIGEIGFSELIIAAGASANPFDITGLEDALEIGSQAAAREAKKAIDALPAGASVAVLGAGFSGCELAGSLAREKNLRIDLIEAMDEILPMYPAELAKLGRQKLEAMGVCVKSAHKIRALCGKVLHCEAGGQMVEKAYDAVVFTAGVRGSELLEDSFIPARGRRVAVDEYLRAPGSENIYVIGDCAAFMSPNGRPFAPTAQIAAQMGKYLGKSLSARAAGEAVTGFKFSDKGSICSLGKADAVGLVGGKQLSGFLAVWLKKFTDIKWDLAIK